MLRLWLHVSLYIRFRSDAVVTLTSYPPPSFPPSVLRSWFTVAPSAIAFSLPSHVSVLAGVFFFFSLVFAFSCAVHPDVHGMHRHADDGEKSWVGELMTGKVKKRSGFTLNHIFTIHPLFTNNGH